MTAPTPDLAAAIDGLYDAFRRYPLRPVIAGCPHCIGQDDQADLHVTPLRRLTDQALGRFAFKTMTTWGDPGDFRHFLPRLLELALSDGQDAIDLDVVLGKLDIARWRNWPDAEQRAIIAYLRAMWKLSRSESAGSPRYGVEELLEVFARTGLDLAPYLAALATDPSERSLRQVAALCRSAAARPAAGNPAAGNPAGGNPAGGNPAGGNPAGGNPVAGRSIANGPPHLRQVRPWLAAPATRALLEAGFFGASSAEVAAELSEAVLIAEAIAAGY